MRIAVDAMGGDQAPEAVVEGAARASALPGYQVLLVGPAASIGPLLARRPDAQRRIRIVEAPDVIEMGEPPAQAVRRKPNASLVVCGELVKRGEADAFVSAGNTGAGMAVAALKLGRIPGIDRPAIATLLPSRSGSVVMLDAGANVDSSAHNLLQFAIMGSIYAENVLGLPEPRVGLLNIGEEDCKGNEMVQQAFGLLRAAPINFVGNIEGGDIFQGTVDVVVCDGFVGNVVLKVGEGVAAFLRALIRDEFRGHPWLQVPARILLRPALRRIARKTDYEETGGAQLLGVQGVCIISHGRSNAHALANAVHRAGEAVKHGIVERIANHPAIHRAEAGVG